MNAIANQLSNKVTQTQVKANELIPLLHALSPKVKVLSLDCFDTLLWRKTAAPMDVFYDLQLKPTFRSLGLTTFLRTSAEEKARNAKRVGHRSNEVMLQDIYQQAFPTLASEKIAALIEEELSAEIEACFAFMPVVELMRAAKQLKLKIVIVSDTYLNEAQLTRLLKHHLPKDAMAAIDKIFCSCEYGLSKQEGLFQPALKYLNISPNAVVHIGDNEKADLRAAKTRGMHGYQFVHHPSNIKHLLNMQEIAGCLFDGNIRNHRPFYSPFRAVLAAHAAATTPAVEIGYYSLGQILYSFACFIRHEVEVLKETDKNPTVLFLMRDGYLPSLVCEAIAQESFGTRVRISRFSAIAAALRTKQDVQRYLGQSAGSGRFKDICRQLLLPESMSATILKKVDSLSLSEALDEFVAFIEQPATLQQIFTASKNYRARLIHYLKKEAGIQRGDTLMFVDLGYTGTAQIELSPVLKDEMDIDIVGRYLIALQTPGWEDTRRGMLDSSLYDHRTMQTLVTYVALLEQLCTSGDASVVDYTEEGEAIFSDATVDKKQTLKNEPVQAECIRFAKDAEQFINTLQIKLSPQMLRDIAMAELGRLLFFPSQSELAYLQSYQFDINMGAKDILPLFDMQSGLNGLQKRGLFFMEKNVKSLRTNYPAELRSAGMELVITLMASHRYSLNFQPNVVSHRKENVMMIIMRNNQATKATIEAQYTYDGYFAMLIPVGNNNIQIGMVFGQHYRWIELKSAELLNVQHLYAENESLHTTDVSAAMMAEQMKKHNEHLYECLSEQAVLAYLPNLSKQPSSNDNYVLRVVFRPIEKR